MIYNTGHYCPVCYRYFYTYYMHASTAPYQQQQHYNHYIDSLPYDRSMQFLVLPTELKNLAGKKIRTTVPNIAGTVTATVGAYNETTNRVQLINIVSERTGVNYGNLTYLPEEISGLEVLGGGTTTPGTGAGTAVEPDAEIGDCSVTGGKGKQLDSGQVSLIDILTIDYTVYECEIEARPRIVGIQTGDKYVITRQNNRVGATWPGGIPFTRYTFAVWVQNKELWAEIQFQRKDYHGEWKKVTGERGKLGSWASLKI